MLPCVLKMMIHPPFFLIKRTEVQLLKSNWLQSCQSKKKKKKKKKKKITSASLFGHILVQSGWSAVALVIIIYSRQSVWFYVFYSTKN